MLKKKRKSKKPDKVKKISAVHDKTSTTEVRIDENPLNFGGLPDRDLKKNLGCG